MGVSIIAPHTRTARSVLAIPLILIFALCLAQGTFAQPAPPPPSCQSAEHRQFDFWVGDWEVRTADGKLAGTNRIERILNDCVLLENWQGSKGSAGKSFNMYFGRDKTWRQTWVDGNGGRLDLSGGLDGSDMVLAGEMPGRDGSSVRHEIRWTPLEDGRVKQYWRVLPAGKDKWQDAFVGFYSRKAEAPRGEDKNEHVDSP